MNNPTRKINRPPLRSRGGKWRIGPWILQHFPEHETYCEPFAGGASLLFRKEPSAFEIINDIDGDVTNYFQMLRERPKELVRALEFTPYAEQEHAIAWKHHDDPLERARRFYIRCAVGWGASGKQSGFRVQKASYGWGKSVTSEFSQFRHLRRAARRLKNVQVMNRDALEVIERIDGPGAFFYCDPPYPVDARSGRLYRKEMMAEEQHRELAETLHSIKGSAIISTGDSPLYSDLFRDWRCVERNALGEQHKVNVERLYLSPNCKPLGEVAGTTPGGQKYTQEVLV